MGDRANVRILDPSWPSDVYLYTHWSGTGLPEIVRRALMRNQRWTDSSYLARIVFSEMIRDEVDGETGYGISSTVGDGDDRVLTLNTDEQSVGFPDGRKCSFLAFTRMASVAWEGGKWEGGTVFELPRWPEAQ